jgi:guanylate cyclase
VRERLLAALQGVGVGHDDSADVALQKQLLVTISVQLAVLAFLWGLVYLAFGEPLAGAIPLGYSLLSFASLALFLATGRFGPYRATQLGLILVLPFLLQLSLGGFVPGSAVIVWAFCAPIGALLVSTRQVATTLLVVFGVLVLLAELLQPWLDPSNSLPAWLIATFFALNLVGTAVVTYLAMVYFIGQKDRAYALLSAERARSERLLLNVLPAPVADRLKHHDGVIADRFEAVSVLFADIVGFTPLSAGMSADELVALLDRLFSRLDEMTQRRGLEKIRTIGDAYMVAAGIPVPRPDHAAVLVDLGLEMNRAVDDITGREGLPLRLRIGVNSGPAVAGVIGRIKFQYDLWGDTVNMASRMESHGVPGRLQITESTLRLVEADYLCEPRGLVDVKGKGPVPTWLVVGPRSGLR